MELYRVRKYVVYIEIFHLLLKIKLGGTIMKKQDLSAALSNFTSTTNAKIEKLEKVKF